MAGGINADFGNLDKEDSWRQHFVDTFLEGYYLSNPKIKILFKDQLLYYYQKRLEFLILNPNLLLSIKEDGFRKINDSLYLNFLVLSPN